MNTASDEEIRRREKDREERFCTDRRLHEELMASFMLHIIDKTSAHASPIAHQGPVAVHQALHQRGLASDNDRRRNAPST